MLKFNVHFSWQCATRLQLLLLWVTGSQWEGENIQVPEIVLVLLPLLQQEVDTVGKSVKQCLSISSLSKGRYIPFDSTYIHRQLSKGTSNEI